MTSHQRNYTQMNDVSHAHAQVNQVLNSLDCEKRQMMNAYEQQVKMEFEDCSNQYNNTHQMDYQTQISQSLPDIRSTYHHLSPNAYAANYQRTKSLSHPSSPSNFDSGSSDGGDSPKIIKKSSSTSSAPSNNKKESSRPRMYKFNPKPLTLNPSMKRNQTPTDNKDGEYWEKRKKNNEASRRSRLARRLKECMVMEEMKKLKKENEELKAELSKMQNAAICRM